MDTRGLAGRLMRVPGAVRLAASVIGLVPPFEFVQVDVERNLHRHLRVGPEGVRLIVVVGAWQGREVTRMLHRYPRCRFVCLEPRPEDFRTLKRKFAGEPRVTCVEAAASDTTGEAVLHGLSEPGTSSLRAPRSGARTRDVTVRSTRLDDLPELAAEAVDCIWVDVQGAEALVLGGAPDVLARTRSVFLEVWTGETLYEQTAGFDEIAARLGAQGFSLAGLGLDPESGIGNALWLQPALRAQASRA
jgi:FkbM family methyltransferase